MQLNHYLKSALAFLLMILLLIPSAPAYAWKPTTHVFLADEALRDALDDNRVSIYQVNYETGQILNKIGDYEVDSQLIAALKANTNQYRAGVLGPDAYPDILTGQQVIHPSPDGPTGTGISGGSGAWLKYLWEQSQVYNTPAVKAFTTGFITHAAGDMYGHTFVNNFTGAPFEIKPPVGPENAIKHIVVEGYVDKRLNRQALATNFFNVSIAGVEDFIYLSMVNAQPGTVLDGQLLRANSSSTEFSIPRIYSTLRANLQRDIDAYYAKKDEYMRRADACQPLDFTCSRVAILAELGVYIDTNGPIVTYKEAWRDDVDIGLRAWPQVSHEVAKALFFNPSWSADTQKAEDILQHYVTDHLLSMSGAPDFVGLTASVISDIIAAITPDFLLEPIRQLKEDLLNALVKSAFGMTKDELKAYLTSPNQYNQYFDQVMTGGAGERITLQRFNSNYLHISDIGYTNPTEAFDYRRVPAAYNTVTMSKLILLKPNEVNRLLRDLFSDLGSPAPVLNESNIMLGFIRTLDGDNQWFTPSKMVLAQDCRAYRKVFMRQPGERDGCSLGSDGAALTVDQENNPRWTGGAVNIAPANQVSQSFVPSRSCLAAVEVGLKTGNPGRGGDQVTLKILGSNNQLLASTSASIPEGFDGFWRFNLPGGGVNVTPGQTITMKIEDTNKIVFFWKYQGNNSYAAGQAFFYGSTNDMLFKTYASNSCRS